MAWGHIFPQTGFLVVMNTSKRSVDPFGFLGMKIKLNI